MEIAMPACHHRDEFRSQIRPAMLIDAFYRSIAALQVEAAVSRFEYDDGTTSCMVSKRIIAMDEMWPSYASSREHEAYWDSASFQKNIMQHNGRILVTGKTDELLCFEYMPKGNLGNYLSDECHEYVWQTRFNIVKGICTILAYLHGQLKSRICHLDVKPANMLLDWNMAVKITDFGLPMCMPQLTRFDVSTGTNGIVKYNNGRIVLADMIADMIDRSIYYEYMHNSNLGEYHGLVDWSTRFSIAGSCTSTLAYLHEGFYCHMNFKPADVLLDENTGLVLMLQAVCSKRSEISPEEFAEIVHQNLRNRSKFESSSKQIRRLNQIVLNCLETVKSTMAMIRLVSSTQRRAAISGTVYTTVLNTMQAYITALNMASVDLVLDSDDSALAAALSVHQHIYRSNLADERSDKPRSNRAPATNSSDETTRAPMANKLTDDEAENHSDPNSCVVERDTIEEAKRSGEWCVATGAAHHTTWNRDLITNMEELENDGIYVHAADGTPMPVRGRGNVVTDDVVLPDVYYVPGLCTNLVSVGQLAGLDYCVGFGRGACVISSATGTVVGRAHARGDGLYELDFLRVPLGMP